MNDQATQDYPNSLPGLASYDLSKEIWSGGILVANVIGSSVDASISLGVPPSYVSSPSPEHDLGFDYYLPPSPWEVSLAREPTSRGSLNRLLVDGVVTMSSEDDTSTSLGAPVTFKPPSRRRISPSMCHPSATWLRSLSEGTRHLQTEYHVRDPFLISSPRGDSTVDNPPPGCVAVYKQDLDNGLRFPLHPFIEELLIEYNLSITQLVPNSWLTINAYIATCSLLGAPCTVTAFRNTHRLQEVPGNVDSHGWYAFHDREFYLTINTKPTSQKGFRHTFLFIFHAGGWRIPRDHSGVPRIGLNYNVPAMGVDEAVPAVWLQSYKEKGSKDKLPTMWIVKDKHFKKERFLSVVGLSHTYDSGRTCIFISCTLYIFRDFSWALPLTNDFV